MSFARSALLGNLLLPPYLHVQVQPYSPSPTDAESTVHVLTGCIGMVPDQGLALARLSNIGCCATQDWAFILYVRLGWVQKLMHVMLRRVGQSDPHAGRSFQSFSEDVAQVADKLGIKSFFVVGVRWARSGCLNVRHDALLSQQANDENIPDKQDYFIAVEGI